MYFEIDFCLLITKMGVIMKFLKLVKPHVQSLKMHLKAFQLIYSLLSYEYFESVLLQDPEHILLSKMYCEEEVVIVGNGTHQTSYLTWKREAECLTQKLFFRKLDVYDLGKAKTVLICNT